MRRSKLATQLAVVTFGLKPFLDEFLSKNTRLVLLELEGLEGDSQYEIVKKISKDASLATSTIKYILKKLKSAELVDYNGSVKLSRRGKVICNELRGSSLNGTEVPISSELRSKVTKKSTGFQTQRCGCESRLPHSEAEVKNAM